MSILGQLQFRRDTAANWTSNNPVLLSGEIGLESDTDKFKIGNGTSTWTARPYGGIKGDQGVQGVGIASITRTSGTGAAGTTDTYTITYTNASTSTFTVKNGSSVVVGATTVVTPATGPSVSDADGGDNVDLRFSLPRARNVSAGTTNTITPATNPSVSSGTDGNGDVSLTFNLPRARTVAAGTANTITPVTAPSVSSAENGNGDVSLTLNLPRARAVTAGTTTTGSPGTNASVSSVNDGSGDVTLNFTIPRGDVGPAGQSVAVAEEGSTLTSAATSLNFVGGGVTATNTGGAVTLSIPSDAVSDVIAGSGLRKTTLGSAITLINKLADGNVYFATDYGTLTSGIDTGFVSAAQADTNTATINAAIAAASSTVAGKKPGGIVLLPPGTFHISSQINITTSCVVLTGAGAYSNSDVGAQTGFGTTLFWNVAGSAATLAMVKVSSPVSPTGAAVKRAGIEGISLQCAGNIGRGLYVESIHYGSFKDLYIINATNQGLFATCLVTGTQLGEAADNTKCLFENISVRMIEAGATATGIRLDGVANANTSNSTFRNIAVLCTGAQIALDLGNTDSNHFYSTIINQVNGSTGQPVRLRGGTASGLECRGNVFYYLACGGSSNGTRGMYNEGTEIAGITAPAKNNAVFGYSIENGEPYPIIGTGATLFYQIVGGTQPFKLNSALLTDTAFSNAVIPTVASLVIPANAITPGTTFEFTMAGSVINTTAASNLVCNILINGAAVATATLALGTVAAASPGRGFWYRGSVTFRSVGASGSASSNGLVNVAALAIASNQVAPTTVNTTAAVTLAMRINTSAATSTGTVRQATIIQGN